MKVEIAGVTIDAPIYVAIGELDRARPIYHDGWSGNVEDGEPGSGDWRRYSTCGLLVVELRNGEVVERKTEIPTRHARRFARPCRKCWRELGPQLELDLLVGPLS